MNEIDVAIDIAQRAGEILLKYFMRDPKDLSLEFKRDKFDPVTRADKEADAFIRTSLAKAFPEDAILSEESSVRPTFKEKRIWVVDPLDGTKHFVVGSDCFSTIIGLLENGKPKLGIVNIPARKTLYYAEKGKGAFRMQQGEKKSIKVSPLKHLEEARALTRNFTSEEVRPIEAVTKQLHFASRTSEGSIGTKISLIAEGNFEAFIHTTGSSKWDTLGAQVILEEAGGVLSFIDGSPLDYLQKSVTWENYLLATNNHTLQGEIMEALKNINSSQRKS